MARADWNQINSKCQKCSAGEERDGGGAGGLHTLRRSVDFIFEEVHMGINVHLAEPGRCETAALMTTTCFSMIMIKLSILAWKCSEYEATEMDFKAFFTSQHHIFLCFVFTQVPFLVT